MTLNQILVHIIFWFILVMFISATASAALPSASFGKTQFFVLFYCFKMGNDGTRSMQVHYANVM